MDFPSLEFGLVRALTFSVLFAFCSIGLHHFKLSHFLFAFLTSLLLIIQKFEIIFQCACDLFSHEFVFLNGKWHVLLFILRIVKSGGCLDRVTMGYVFQDNGPGSSPFELGNTKKTRIVPEHLRIICEEFREDSSFVIAGLPDLVLWAIKKNILFDRVTMKIEKHYQSIFPLLLQFYHEFLESLNLGN